MGGCCHCLACGGGPVPFGGGLSLWWCSPFPTDCLWPGPVHWASLGTYGLPFYYILLCYSILFYSVIFYNILLWAVACVMYRYVFYRCVSVAWVVASFCLHSLSILPPSSVLCSLSPIYPLYIMNHGALFLTILFCSILLYSIIFYYGR